MSLNPLADGFIHSDFAKDTVSFKKAQLLVKCSLLTSIFSGFYLLLSLYIDFQIGVYLMIFNVVGYLILPFSLRYKVNLTLIGNVFIFIGALAISLIVHHSGGIWSPTLVWLSAVPVLAAFLVNRKSTIVWGVLMYGLTLFYGISEILEVSFPVSYTITHKSMFMMTSASGFLVIILVIAMVFESNTRQAVKSLAITNQKMVEVNNDKDYIIQIMAHDLRNPLHNIKSWLNILSDGGYDIESPEEIYQMMEESIDSSTHLIDKVTKIGAFEHERLLVTLQEMDIREVVQRVVDGYQTDAEAKSIRLSNKWKEEDFFAKIDITYMSQIVDNLVSNAVKYTRKGGNILVTIVKKEAKIQVAVKDQGPGLSKEDQGKLFKKFSRLDVRPTGGESSTGLGLYLVKKYANLMKGDVWCESELDIGSTFILSIPAIHSTNE